MGKLHQRDELDKAIPPVLLPTMEDEELDEILVNTVDVIPLLAV
jgi:hypothetical protein